MLCIAFSFNAVGTASSVQGSSTTSTSDKEDLSAKVPLSCTSC